MSTSRNLSEAPLPPPPAPPLPPPSRYGQRAATAIARFAQPFLYGSRPSSAQGHREVKTPKPTSFRTEVARTSSPSSSKTAVHKTGIIISALDVSPYRSHAVLAGREILKTIRVQDTTCNEEFNLRSEIIAYASTHNSNRDAISASHRDQLAACDVKWSHGNFDTTIATAASNGRIIIYDLNKPSVEIARLHEHTRQVHRIAFNPHQPAYLLSGSQDGTIRLWDLRALGGEHSVRTCGSWKKFIGNSEGIRDVKWSPADGVVFAVGTESGILQRWDFAKESAPLLKLHAHDKSCNSIDWHPSGKYIASGGVDKSVKVWDFGSSERRMKPSWVLRTPQTINKLNWRPEVNSKEEAHHDLKRTSQIATIYDDKDPRIHVWDFKRPHVPFQELDRYDTPATDFLWHSEHLLWSVGSTGTFTQSHLTFATKPSERQNINSLAMSSSAQISFFAEERNRRHVSIAEPTEHALHRVNTGTSSEGKFSSSQSANEGSLEEPSLLSTSFPKRRQKLTVARAATIASPTKNVIMGTTEHQGPIDELLTTTFRSSQLVAIGHILGLFDADAFSHLARNYELPSATFLNHEDSKTHETIRAAFNEYARFAEDTGQYRLAQSWRILGQMAYSELFRRAEASKQFRPSNPQAAKQLYLSTTQPVRAPSQVGPVTLKGNGKGLPYAGEDLSNMSTPLARPSQEDPPLLQADRLLDSLDEGNSGLLGPAWKARAPLTSLGNVSGSSDREGASSVLSDSLDFALNAGDGSPEIHSPHQVDSTTASFRDFSDIEQQMQERRSAISNYRARPRAVLRLDDTFNTSQTLTSVPPLDRHDSNESFQMFSASIESDRRSYPLGDSFGDRRLELSQTPEGTWVPASQPRSAGAEIRRDRLTDLGTTTPHVVDLASSSQPSPVHRTRPSNLVSITTPRRISPVRRPSIALPAKVHRRQESLDISPQDKPQALAFEPTDFFLTNEPTVELAPWRLSALLPPLIEYHLNILSDCQLPSILALWLATLFPHCFKRRQITSYVSSYLSRLSTLRLFEPAANLRNACENVFPEVLETSVGAGMAHWYCPGCRGSPVGNKLDLCAQCSQPRGRCPICESDTIALLAGQAEGPDQIANLWTWCQGCGHGGHSSCLAVWFSDAKTSEGTCAVTGCGHDCVAGSRRNAKISELEILKKRGRKSVIQDDWAVDESKAVERARDIVVVDVRKGKGASRSSTVPNRPSGLGPERRVRLKVPESREQMDCKHSQDDIRFE